MKKYDVAAFIWPSYTGDEPRTRIFWPEGMGEWETVIAAKPKFEGHAWPRKPLWGYCNEADPAVMEMQIEQATRHGINVFIYDWYWYDGRPFLENCLNDGFLKAANNKKMKFFLMWANHNVNHLWDRRLAGTEVGKTIIWNGAPDFTEFQVIVDRWIEKYFCLDNYYTIDSKPVLMIYDIENLVVGFGGIENTRKAMDYLREKVKEAGFEGLHLQFCCRTTRDCNAARVGKDCTFGELSEMLGADSVTNYHIGQNVERNIDFSEQLELIKENQKLIDRTYTMPYFPHISCGWDNNPRHQMLMPTITTGNTPEKLEEALRVAKEYVDSHDLPAPLITVNSWNEWTEGSYLQPDDLYGYGYLEAAKRVFVDEE